MDKYFAGFFDGEGCVFIYGLKNLFHLNVAIANTNPKPLIVGQARYGGYVRPEKCHRGNKPFWMWRMTGKTAAKFLSKIFPYVIIKKDEVAIALEYMEKYPPQKGRPVTDEQVLGKKKYQEELRRLKKVIYPFPVDITGAGTGAV